MIELFLGELAKIVSYWGLWFRKVQILIEFLFFFICLKYFLRIFSRKKKFWWKKMTVYNKTYQEGDKFIFSYFLIMKMIFKEFFIYF